MGMWTAPSDLDYRSEMMQDLDDGVCPGCLYDNGECHCFDEQDEADQFLDIEREERD